jgi:hypothetical protein
MKPGIKKIWLKALRSGEYKQGRKSLCRTDRGESYYCCLGVLANECADGFWILRESDGPVCKGEPNSWNLQLNNAHWLSPWYLPPEFLKQVGLSSYEQSRLSDMNDHYKYNFETIAKWIEGNL